MLFLCLIPLAMVDQRPTCLFDIGEKCWPKYTASLPANTWVDLQHLPDFGPILQNFDATSPIFEAVVNKPHYMRALFVAQVKGTILQSDLLLICYFMDSQPLTKSGSGKKEDKQSKASNQQSTTSNPLNKASTGDSAVVVQSSVQKGSMITSNLIRQTKYVKDGALTVVPHASLAQDMSQNQLQKDAVQPQAATAHEYKEIISPERTVKLHADAVSTKSRELTTQQNGKLLFTKTIEEYPEFAV